MHSRCARCSGGAFSLIPGGRFTAATLAALLSALVLGGCGGEMPVRDSKLVAVPAKRYTDAVIQRDWLAIAELEAYLAERESDMDAYAAQKVRYLIKFAIDEYHENDRSGVIGWALDTAEELIEAPTSIAQRELALKTAPRGRNDAIGLLVQNAGAWNSLIQAQQHDGALPCAAESLARYYAGLVWLAHEQWEVATGLQRPGHEHEASKRMDARRSAMGSALEPAALRPCVDEPPAVAPVSPPPPPTAETFSENVLFSFDGDSRADLLPGAEETLADVSFHWQKQAEAYEAGGRSRLPEVVLIAHTDRLGSEAYNLRLAARRAQTVRAILLGHGIPDESIEIHNEGSEQPIARGCEAQQRRDGGLISCLAPDRRVELILPFALPARQRSVSQ